jgi:aspartate/glutamate racemase
LKTIGLIGGMSWESTVPYYRQINETIKDRLGGLHSAKIVLYSVDFHDIERLQHAGDWEAAGVILAKAACALEAAGSEFLVLCTNTMHNVAHSGVVLPESRSQYRRIMESLASQGAEAIILGCTELSLLVSQQDSKVPLFDTTAIHARAAAEKALAQ